MNDLRALDGRDIRVEVAHLDARLPQVLGEVLCHALGERRDEDALIALDAQANLTHEIVDLSCERAHLDLGIEEPRRADDLLSDLLCLLHLIFSGRRGDVDDLIDARRELLERQRTVVERGRQAKAVVHERDLAAAVAAVHGVNLRQGHMRLVDHDEKVLGKVIEEGVRCRARRAVREVTRVVLDAGAVAHLLHHFEVIVRALLQPLRFKEFALTLQYGETLLKLRANVRHGDLHILIVRDVVGRRKHHGVKPLSVDLARRHVELDDALYLVAEHLDAHAAVVVPRGEDLDHVAAHAEASALKRDIVALVADGDELLQDLLARDRLPLVHGENHLMIALRRAEAVDARDARHDDDVAPLKERTGRGVAQLIDLIVDRRILFNIGIRLGDVRLGLIEVVVADKVADVVVGEK